MYFFRFLHRKRFFHGKWEKMESAVNRPAGEQFELRVGIYMNRKRIIYSNRYGEFFSYVNLVFELLRIFKKPTTLFL